jgi:ORF6N domain.
MDIVKLEKVENKIIEIRGHKVLLDSDVAELYEVETKRVNEAVKNNPDKFPDGYLFDLSEDEWGKLKSKFSSSIKGGKVKLPKAFTEKGLYMLATILKSKKATSTTIAIIETFAKVKNLSKNIKELSNAQHGQQRQNLLQKSGEIISDILYDDLVTNASETSIEINFAVLKFKHTIKKSKK